VRRSHSKAIASAVPARATEVSSLSRFLPHHRSITAIWMAWLVLIPFAGIADAEIYACPGKSGAVTYQNFPCPYSSLGSMPSTATRNDAAVKAPASAKAAESTAGDTARPSPPRGTAPARNRTAGEMRVGMSADDMRKTWGEPEEIVQDEPRKGGPVEIWRYKDGRAVRIDHRQRVVDVQL